MIKFLIPLLFIANVVNGAVTATTRWNFDNATGSSANGGGFDPSPGTGVDMSLGAATNITGAACAGAGNVFTHASASSNWTNNVVNVVSGTNFTTTAGSSRFLITSVVGTSVTVATNAAGTSICTGASVDGNINIGGALTTYNSATDDALFEQFMGGNKVYFKKNASSYNLGTITLSATPAATAANPIMWIGYNSAQGDNPTIASGNQPTLNSGANNIGLNLAGPHHLLYFTYTNTGTTGITLPSYSIVDNSKFTNTSGTANRTAFNGSSLQSFFVKNSEFSSTNGYAIQVGNTFGGHTFINNYIHDSSVGFKYTSGTATGTMIFEENIFKNVTVAAIDYSSFTQNGWIRIKNNTFYCASSPTGSSKAIDILSGSVNFKVINNIFYGCVTALNAGSNSASNEEDYNDFFNNTTNRVNWNTGANSITLDPGFKDAPNGNFTPSYTMGNRGFPTAYPGGAAASINYIDLGAIQRKQGLPRGRK